MKGHKDLRLACALALASAVLTLLLPWGPLCLVVALPLIFFLPGYAVAAAIFARGRIPLRHLLVLSLGLSLAVLALGALPLNYLPGGVRAGWWALLLVIVVFAAARAAAIRRPSHRAAPRPSSPWKPRLNPAQAGLFTLGALAVVAAIVLAFIPVGAKNALGYTQMWIQPLAGAKTGVEIGVGSAEQKEASYRLWVKFGGGEAPQGRYFKLAPGETQIVKLLTEKQPVANEQIRAALFKRNGPDHAYRRVSTWITPTNPG
jgi:uncharacterized membrane protein